MYAYPMGAMGPFGTGPWEILIILVFASIMIIPTIFYLITLQTAFSRCSTECRTLSPGQVWLLLIPIFNLIWHFFIVINLSQSLANEFRKRGMVESSNPGKEIGLAMAILSVVSIIPYIGILTGIAALICWIVYWVKIAEFSSKIAFPQPTES